MTEAKASELAVVYLVRSLATAFGKALPPDQKSELVMALRKERATCQVTLASITTPDRAAEHAVLTIVRGELSHIIDAVANSEPAED